jgi:hypothetical protein
MMRKLTTITRKRYTTTKDRSLQEAARLEHKEMYGII